MCLNESNVSSVLLSQSDAKTISNDQSSSQIRGLPNMWSGTTHDPDLSIDKADQSAPDFKS